jgi:hypothetical protein
MACPIESSAHDQLLPADRRHRTSISEMRCNAILSNTLLSALRAEVFQVRIADQRNCSNCGRAVSWLDIVASALDHVHSPVKIAEVILGDRKWVNVEAPAAIAGVRCFECGTPKLDVRSFKCHNWACAIGDLEAVVREMARRAESEPQQ